LIRSSIRFASEAVLVAFSLTVFSAAQQQVPATPPQDATPAAPAALAPSAAPVFPKPDPANFTAASPTKETIDNFLQTSWGYDENRIWQVQAILKTPVEGLSKVVIFVGDKTGKMKPSAVGFFVLQDGKHIIADDQVIAFGDHPFAEYRKMVEDRADGPYRGSASKELEMVEFADFQCPHCKDAQANMDKLAVDFPKARIVFQNYPLAKLHPQAVKAAEYAVCVTKQGGSNAFFQYTSSVFDGQDGLATPDGATLTLNSAVVKAGLDPVKIAACSSTPEVGHSVEASVKLAQDLNINETPTLVINGRQIPIGGAPYDVIKKIVEYQEKLDGITQ
jgi:protein-disulfide isomerase